MTTAAPVVGPMLERIEGYEVTGPRTYLSPRRFVQRGTMRGRPWLVFLKKIEQDGYWVTAYKTKKEAVQS